MKKTYKLSIILISILLLSIIYVNSIYTDKIECDEHTIIISVCTGNMRALETGIAVYAGYNEVPLILSDKTLPEQLNSWLPGYVKQNNITKIIVVGQVTPTQLINFIKLGVTVKQVTGDSIAEILTKIAQNDKQIHKDEIILTASDPQAAVLGAYKKVPVFITATNSSYESSNILDKYYTNFLIKNNIKKVTVVGNIPENIKEQIKELNITIENISGQTSIDVTKDLNQKLINEGYLDNLTTAFYGFYGEIPTIIPTLIKEKAILIEDSSNMGNIINYLKENDIETVYILRNREVDYIQMEERDYISTKTIKSIENSNITIKYLTKPRTLDEATGLYDMEILTAQFTEGNEEKIEEEYTDKKIKTQPPLIEILNEKEIKDSNNLTSTIIKENNNDFIVKWNTIHPYYWKKIDNNKYYVTTKTGYEYMWKKENDTWIVQYTYNNSNYYTIKWIKNDDYSWTERHEKEEYLWKYDGIKWKCYNKENELIYYIEKIN